MAKLLKYKNILFDEWTEDEYGTWATICPICLHKYSDRFSSEIDLDGSGCCSVYGCTQKDDKEIDIRYIDFDVNIIELVEWQKLENSERGIN